MPRLQRLTTYGIVFLVSGTGFLTQTLISGWWTSAFSEDIYHYALHIAFFFLSLGLGALAAECIKKPTKIHLYLIAVTSTLWLGLVIPLLKCTIVWWGGRTFLPILCVVIQGILVGSIVPLVLKLSEKDKHFSLGKLFFVDYVSALVLSCVFTFFFLVPFGFSKTGLIASVTGTLALLILWFSEQKKYRKYGILVVPLIIFVCWSVDASKALVSIRKEVDKSSKVVFSRQSHYQKIVLMEEASYEKTLQGERQHVLYLDGFLQFATSDEQSYHACIANVPLMAYFHENRTPKHVLILGGGDGLVARNVLLVPGIEKVTLVELDPEMIEIAKNHPILKQQNLDSLHSPKMEIITADAFRWISESDRKFDVVIIDFPLPKNLTLARLYAAEFYRDVFKVMSENGVVAIQAGPSFSYEDPSFETLSKVTASVLKSIEGLGQRAWAYTSVLDNEAFVLATHSKTFEMDDFARKNSMDEEKGFGRLCAYRTTWKRPQVAMNTLNTLPIAGYMLDWFKAGQINYFHYRGVSANFLPE